MNIQIYGTLTPEEAKAKQILKDGYFLSYQDKLENKFGAINKVSKDTEGVVIDTVDGYYIYVFPYANYTKDMYTYNGYTFYKKIADADIYKIVDTSGQTPFYIYAYSHPRTVNFYDVIDTSKIVEYEITDLYVFESTRQLTDEELKLFINGFSFILEETPVQSSNSQYFNAGTYQPSFFDNLTAEDAFTVFDGTPTGGYTNSWLGGTGLGNAYTSLSVPSTSGYARLYLLNKYGITYRDRTTNQSGMPTSISNPIPQIEVSTDTLYLVVEFVANNTSSGTTIPYRYTKMVKLGGTYKFTFNKEPYNGRSISHPTKISIFSDSNKTPKMLCLSCPDGYTYDLANSLLATKYPYTSSGYENLYFSEYEIRNCFTKSGLTPDEFEGKFILGVKASTNQTLVFGVDLVPTEFVQIKFKTVRGAFTTSQGIVQNKLDDDNDYNINLYIPKGASLYDVGYTSIELASPTSSQPKFPADISDAEHNAMTEEALKTIHNENIVYQMVVQ